MTITKKLTPKDVKNCKPVAKGGKELISNIKAAFVQYVCGGWSAAATGAGIMVGNPSWAVAMSAVAAAVCFAIGRYYRKKAQAQIKRDYKVR